MVNILRGYRPYLFLTLLCVLLYLPGISKIPVIDGDEAVFIQSTKQMMESHQYLFPQYQEDVISYNPMGANYIQSFFVKVFYSDIGNAPAWLYRLPSFLGGWLGVMLTFVFGKYLFDKRAAFLASSLLASSLLLVVQAHMAGAESLNMAASVAVLGAMGISYIKTRYKDELNNFLCNSWVLSLIFWASVAASFVLKGPAIFIMVALAYVCISFNDGKWKWVLELKPWYGLILFFALVSPWIFAVAEQYGVGYFAKYWSEVVYPLLTGEGYNKSAPFGYYVLFISLFYWPSSLFLWPGLVGAKREIERPSFRFCVAWLIPYIIVLEMIPYKDSVFVLPLFPAMSYVVAGTVLRAWQHTEVLFMHWAAKIWFVVWSIIGFVIAGLMIYLPVRIGSGFNFWSIFAAIGACLGVIVTMQERKRLLYYRAIMASVIGACIIFLVTFQLALPNIKYIWLSKSIKEALVAQNYNGEVFAVGYDEPSLFVYHGTKSEVGTPHEAVDYLEEHPDNLVIVNASKDTVFRKMATKEGIKVKKIGRVEGFNFKEGRNIIIGLYKLEGR